MMTFPPTPLRFLSTIESAQTLEAEDQRMKSAAPTKRYDGLKTAVVMTLCCQRMTYVVHSGQTVRRLASAVAGVHRPYVKSARNSSRSHVPSKLGASARSIDQLKIPLRFHAAHYTRATPRRHLNKMTSTDPSPRCSLLTLTAIRD